MKRFVAILLAAVLVLSLVACGGKSNTQNENKRIKYVLEIIIIFCLEYAITSGVFDIMDESSLEKKAERKPKLAPKATVINTDE